MKTTTTRTGGAVGLVEWLKPKTLRFSLAVGATCECDITRLGRGIRDYLNRPGSTAGGPCRVFDPDEIRQLAGDPFWRNSILAAAALHGAEEASHCDYENTVRAVAKLGGAILPGEAALEATADLDNVFRVALSHCERCRPATVLNLDPDGFSPEGLAAVIGKRFLRWCEKREQESHPEKRPDTRLHSIG